MRSTLAIVLLLLALALGFVHGAAAFKADREAALGELFPPAPPAPPTARKAAGAEGGGSAGAVPGTGAVSGAGAGAGAGAGGGVGEGAGSGPREGGGGAASSAGASVEAKDASEEEIAAVHSLIAEGEARRKAGEFASARDACAQARRRLEGMKSVVALPLARLAQRGEARAEVLSALAASVPPNDFASGEGLRKLHLKSGREYVARILSLSGGQVSFRLANGIEIALPLSELSKPSEPCPREEWRARCKAGLEERRGKTDEESAFELFRLAAFALENGLPEEAAPILERALEMDRPGLLPEYFCEAGARPSRTTVQLARGGSEAEVASALGGEGRAGATSDAGSSSAGSASGGAAGPEERPLAGPPRPPSPAEGKLLADARWRKALARLDVAIGHYKRSFRGTPDYEKELRSALAVFNEVGTALEALREEFPESEALDAKIVEVNQARVDCRKRAGT
jgi:hypothetical protein